MTDEEKLIIKKEIVKYYTELIKRMSKTPSACMIMAVSHGLDNAQNIINRKE